LILVDSSVWIDYFRGTPTRAADRLDALLGTEPLLVGDLILSEVLQGFTSERDFNHALMLLTAFEVVPLGGADRCIAAARHHRTLRSKGVAVRKTIDTLIAATCIEAGYALLHRDSDFDGFAAYCGLRVVALD